MLPKIERKQALPQADDVEKGLPTPKTMEAFVPERKVVYLVERNAVTWRHWLLMGCTTWLGWMMFFVLVGALAGPDAQVEVSGSSTTYNVATFNGPVVVPLGNQFITSENNMHYFAVIGIPSDGTASDPAQDTAADDYSDYFSIPFLWGQTGGQPKSYPSDIQKLLTLQPGYHAEEGVYVTEPIPPAAGKDLLMALDMDSSVTADKDQGPVNRLSTLQTKLQEMMKQSQDGVVIEVAVTAANETESEGALNKAEESHIDPGLFASVPVIEIVPYYISPKDVQMNWFEALQACWGMGMQLVAIEDQEENQAILQLISRDLHSGDKVDFWTSGTNLWSKDRHRLFWATTGAELSFTSWHTNNPNSPDFQNCVQLTNNLDSPSNGSLRWNDYACYSKNRFICEAPSPATVYQGSGATEFTSGAEVPKVNLDQQDFPAVLTEDIPQQLL